MPANSKQTFRGISRAIFARLRSKALRVGIAVMNPKGEAKKDGVTIRWDYDAREQVLEVECKVPFWINAERINADVRIEIETVIRTAA